MFLPVLCELSSKICVWYSPFLLFPLKTKVTRFHSQLCPYSGTPVGFLSTRLVALCLPPKGNICRSAQWEQEGRLFCFILGTPSPCTVLEGLESTTAKLFTSVQVCTGACVFVSEMASKIQKQSKEWKTMPFVLFKVLSALCWTRTMKYSFFFFTCLARSRHRSKKKKKISEHSSLFKLFRFYTKVTMNSLLLFKIEVFRRSNFPVF